MNYKACFATATHCPGVLIPYTFCVDIDIQTQTVHEDIYMNYINLFQQRQQKSVKTFILFRCCVFNVFNLF